MIFNFLQYLKPIWYFNVKPSVDFGYFLTGKQLEEEGFTIPKDLQYQTDEAQIRDLAWTAFQQGFISKINRPGEDIWQKTTLPVHDEYVFLRKNFHWAWVYYVLLLRLITFHNPFAEWHGFLVTRNVKRVDYSQNAVAYPDYAAFQSPLIASKPLVSVVIPTLNRYQYLKDVLRDLENQTYKNFEVIIVDQTDAFREDFYQGWKLDLNYWFQEEKALWRARNEAIQSAKGDYILLYDDDSLVNEDWIAEHLKVLDYFNADLSSGVSISTVGAEVPKHYRYFRWSDQLDTGNVLLKKSIFKEIGLFDRQFEKQRMGDGEYGMRAYLAGYKNISNYKAQRIHLKVSEGGLRQMGSWDGWRPKKLFGPRPVPSVLYLSRKYFGSRLSRLFIVHSILPSLVPYKFKGNRLLKMMSFLLVPFLLPLVCFQVFKSWQLASAKLKEGPKISQL
ncbi:glycosyltransferase family 2 protein [Flavobacterium humi]|uniref:Glycosyltransferase family 2 protein n=1 Tax=Flavobacterium humi TaxID=2562683 RepID=A0A4Z0L4M9_9FLAO|nr:glycosyltransferase family A protein [Flavobacterium humi]TGD57167.1 glycosyltransferase family 2 protein [Flavobacterium humi]